MILIVGCGFLGSYLAKHISETSDENILAVVHNPEKEIPLKNTEYIVADLTDSADIWRIWQATKGEKLTVFYFAACHNIDFVYQQPDQAHRINITALQSFLCSFDNIEKLFFSSTDCVYGENSGKKLLCENSPLNPVNEYGLQKIQAEKEIAAYGFTTLRLPFMIGPSLFKSFPHFFDRITQSLLNNQKLEMVNGLYRNVLSYSQAAELIFRLAELPQPLPRVINVCSDKGLSKYETGCRIAEHLNLNPDLITAISEREGEKFFKDKRASSSVMDNALLKSLLDLSQIEWEL